MINVDLFARQIIVLQDMTMTMTMYFRQSWTDARLSAFGNNSLRFFQFDKIWRPDLFFRNEMNSRGVSDTADDMKLMKVNKGNVWYVNK